MNKKKAAVIAAIILIILLIPIPTQYKDGGTVEYHAVLYKVTKVHSLADNENQQGYNVGTIVEILGLELFNNVEFVAE